MTFADRRTDLLLKTVNAGHKTLLAVSGGRLGKTAANLAVVKLTTTGRKSGKSRTVMLAAPIHGEGRYILVASKGGDDRHPDWYRNLVANPQITLEPIDGNGPLTLTARTVTGDVKADLWTAIATGSKGYAAYRERTERDIPIVICEPTA